MLRESFPSKAQAISGRPPIATATTLRLSVFGTRRFLNAVFRLAQLYARTEKRRVAVLSAARSG
jgi:hypothetical protein